MKTKLVGIAMEKVVNNLKLGRSDADTVLVALCNRADNIGANSSTAVDSPEGKRLMPSLRKYGLAQAGQKLGRSIIVSDGELTVSPFRAKDTKAVVVAA